VAASRLRSALLAVAGAVCLAALAPPAAAAPPAPVPVAVYVNVDEMSVLWPFRDPKTRAFPAPGEPGREAYLARWNEVINQAFKELRRRVPAQFDLVAARDPNAPYAIKIDVWIADLATTCDAPTFYKYLWVRTYPGRDGFITNWDGLGVRSQTLVDVQMAEAKRRRADLDSWVELWAQVPYLHVAPAPPKAQPEEPAPAPKGTGSDV
jgi:hypothetical protein